ncbi:MAG: hypothetical protein Q7R69_00805 [bacterium]|nr:hypothetical protein [bacterium]
MSVVEKAELSPILGSVPVVMFFFNVTDKRLVPWWAKTVSGLEQKPATEGQPSGVELIRGKHVNLYSVLDEIGEQGFIPVRLLVIERGQGRVRMALVCVHSDHLKEGDRRMPRREEADVRGLLKKLWDVRVHRNPGEHGGNFIIGCAYPAMGNSRGKLLVADGQFRLETK